MAEKKGRALLMVWADIPADKEGDFNGWYNEEHLADVLAVPGVLNAARYEAIRGGPKHLACYELENPAVVDSDAFKNLPRSEWGDRVSPSVIGINYVSNVYQMIRPVALTPEARASDMAPVLQIGRMSVPPEHEDAWNHWYSNVYTTNYEKVPGCIRARRWIAIHGEPKYATVYELEHEKVPQTPEWITQRNIDPSNEPMRSLETHAEGSPGVWKKTFQL